MDPIYSEIYSDMFSAYQSIPRGFGRPPYYPYRMDQGHRNFLTKLADSLLSLSRDFDRVRADALYFLLLNFDQMVYIPFRASDRPVRAPILEQILADARLVLQSAAKEAGDREITAHTIISVLPRIWGDLSTSRLEIWG